ncbi:MAG: hypothetical protein CMO81_08260 [Waddliaceae bacterium]|nr:hypothetical protein [Waddliaceae bacterium]
MRFLIGNVYRVLICCSWILAVDAFPDTMERHSCEQREIQAIKHLDEAGVDLSQIGIKPLQRAAKFGSIEIVKILAKHANINAKNEKYFTALHYASMSGELAVLQFLLDAGITVDNYLYNHPLLMVSRYGHVDCVAPLGCHTDQQTLDKAVVIAAKYGQRDTLEKLLALGGNPNDNRHCSGGKAIHYAALNGDIEILELLVAYGASPNIEWNGRNAVYYAMLSGSAAALNIVLAQGGEVPAVHIAAFDGRIDLLKSFFIIRPELMHEGINTSSSPLMYAISANQKEVVNYLLACLPNNFSPTHLNHAVQLAAQMGQHDVLQALHEIGAGIDSRYYGFDFSEGTPLMVATLHQHVQTVDFLITNGADVNLSSKVVSYKAELDKLSHATPILIAASIGNVEVLTSLLEAGAKIENQWGKISPLQQAARFGHLEVIDRLLDYGADLHLKDSKQRQALHYAAKFGQLATVKKLVSVGSEIEAMDTKGYTAARLAHQHGYHDIEEYLLSLSE